MFPDQVSEEGEDSKVGPSPRKLPKSGETETKHKFVAKAVTSQILNDLYYMTVFLFCL